MTIGERMTSVDPESVRFVDLGPLADAGLVVKSVASACGVLDRLSIFDGGWTLDAAESVVSGGSIRYRLLEVLRQYGRERLGARDRHPDRLRRLAAPFGTKTRPVLPD